VTRHRAERLSRWALPSSCSAITVLAVGLVCTSTGLVKLMGGLILLSAFVGAMWIAQKARFVAIAPAVGLALASLILIGLALAAVQALSTTPVALAVGVVTLAAAWTSSRRQAAGTLERTAPLKPLNPLTIGGVVVFAAAAVFAVHYSVVNAVADSDRASSLAVWAYPSGGQLLVGARQPPGHGSTSLRIVVTQAGITAEVWSHVRLAPGQTWRAPPLALAGNGPIHVVARHGGQVVARLSIESRRTLSAAGSTIIRERPPRRSGRR
jgi:hypothetical protein